MQAYEIFQLEGTNKLQHIVECMDVCEWNLTKKFIKVNRIINEVMMAWFL